MDTTNLPARLAVSSPLGGPINFEGDPETALQMQEDRSLSEHSREVRLYVRDEWIRKQMRNRELEYTDFSSLNVFVGTWNVNGKKPSEPIDQWLEPSKEKRCKPEFESEFDVDLSNQMPDIYVLGFQEIVDLNRPSNVMSDSTSKERSDMWVEKILSTLNKLAFKRDSSPDARYVFLLERHLVGIMLCIFVKEKHARFIPSNKVQTASVATGVMGIVGNKGAISIRLKVYDSELCFVCGHLAAHRENVDGRNADYHNVMNKTSFKLDQDEWGRMSIEEKLSLPARYPGRFDDNSNMDVYGIHRHDYIIWLGDLNYRMSTLSSDEQVFQHVYARDLDWLALNDQLNIERRAGHVFDGFEEAPLTFPPTYKYQSGTSTYDRRPDKKVRAPAWCDRILWKTINPSYGFDSSNLHADIDMFSLDHTKTAGQVNVIEYTSRDEQVLSDHKPVLLDCLVKCRIVAPDKRKKVFMEVMSLLDKWENDAVPKLSIERSTVEFVGGVKYKVPCSQTLELTNSSRVPATWRFIPKMEEVDGRKICKKWLSVSPSFGMLLPGESIQVVLQGFVTAEVARAVIAKTESLNDIILLRVERGTDYYIPVSATLLPTCFGASLTELCRHVYPFRATDSEKEAMAVEREGQNKQHQLTYPKELWHLFNFLWLYGGIHERGLFHHSMDMAISAGGLEPFEEERITIRTCLDTGYEIPPPPICSVHAVAATILELLQSMPGPVIPFDFFPRVDFDSVDMSSYCRKFLEQLPSLHQNVFIHTISFLRELLASENVVYNRLTPGIVATIFGDCLFRPDEVPVNNRPQNNSSGGFDFSQWLSGGESSAQKRKSCKAQAEYLVLYFLSSPNIFL